jgi:hypothetical protein
MSILVAQLGDIHIESSTDLIFERSEKIGAAIAAEVKNDTTELVLLFGGDMSYSGTKDQFDLFKRLAVDIDTSVRRNSPTVNIRTLAVPGNHDCCFAGPQSVRERLLDTIKTDDVLDDEMRGQLLKPLDEYFAYASTLIGKDAGISRATPFYTHFDIREGERVLRFMLVNTAWMSSKREKPASLQFPMSEIVLPTDASPTLTISVLHHPFNWFRQPDTYRPLRERVDSVSDVVLLHHEHVAEANQQSRPFVSGSDGEHAFHVSGGALQVAPGDTSCEFNTIRVELDTRSVTVVRHRFLAADGSAHFERLATAPQVIVERRKNSAGLYQIHQDFRDQLDDLGTPVVHPHRDPRKPLRLSDVFVYPDLWELDDDHSGESRKQIRSKDVFKTVIALSQALVTGSDKSGRTSIAKTLFIDFLRAGFAPLFVDCATLNPKLQDTGPAVEQLIKAQYAQMAPEQFLQLDRGKRVIILDNIHMLARDRVARAKLLKQFEHTFAKVVCLGSDLIAAEEFMHGDSKDTGLWEYKHFTILEFGEVLRSHFVTKWVSLGTDQTLSDQESRQEVERLTKAINTVILKQLLPCYPMFLLVVLQQADSPTPLAQGGSFGHLFQGVVTALLNRSRYTVISIDDKYKYLAALAMRMNQASSPVLSDIELQRWHREYWDAVDLDISFKECIDDLIQIGIVTNREGTYRFKYIYFYCFFIAFAMNRTIHEEPTRDMVRRLCSQLFHRVSADIVLFLAHLTGDPIVLEEMQKTCERLFSTERPMDFDSDSNTISRLTQQALEHSLPDRSAEENRQDIAMSADSDPKGRVIDDSAMVDLKPRQPVSDHDRFLSDLSSATKTIQILGQAIRNVSGSATREVKEQVLAKLVQLSRRTIRSVLMIDDQAELETTINELRAQYKKYHPEAEPHTIDVEVSSHIYNICMFFAFIMVKHTSLSAGAENLMPTVQRLLIDSKDASDNVYGLSFALDRARLFPETTSVAVYNGFAKNQFGQDVIRSLIAHHLYMYPVPYNVRQSVCARTDIKLVPASVNPATKKLK